MANEEYAVFLIASCGEEGEAAASSLFVADALVGHFAEAGDIVPGELIPAVEGGDVDAIVVGAREMGVHPRNNAIDLFLVFWLELRS